MNQRNARPTASGEKAPSAPSTSEERAPSPLAVPGGYWSHYGIQPKLKVGTADDAAEQEADAIAERVADGGAGGRPQVAPGAGVAVQAKGEGGGGGQVDESLAPSGGGAALPSSLRAEVEPAIGRDLSPVRVHTDGRAEDAAHAVQARAFTVGNDISFGRGEYAPDSREG